MRLSNRARPRFGVVLLIALLLVVFSVSVAGAATGMAVIDVTPFGATSVDNSAMDGIESQWYYDAGIGAIYFDTDFGNYTLVGTNSNVCIGSTGWAKNVFVTLDNLTITSTRWSACYISNQNIELMTLVGTNTLTSTVNDGITIGYDSSCTMTGAGSLEIISSPGSAIFVDSTSSLGITGEAQVTARGGATGVAAVQAATDILIGDDASLTIVNNSPNTPATVNVFAESGSTYRWVLTGAATTVDSLTVASIAVNVPQDSTGTIAREPIPVAPLITSPNSLSVVAGTGGQLPLSATGTTPIGWSLSGEPSGVSISNGVLVISPDVSAGSYHFTIVANNAVGADTQLFTLTVTAQGGNGGNGGDNGGGGTGENGTLPAMGEGIHFVAFALDLLASICLLAASFCRKRIS